MVWESTPQLLIKAQYKMRQKRALGFTRHSLVAPERPEPETLTMKVITTALMCLLLAAMWPQDVDSKSMHVLSSRCCFRFLKKMPPPEVNPVLQRDQLLLFPPSCCIQAEERPRELCLEYKCLGSRLPEEGETLLAEVKMSYTFPSQLWRLQLPFTQSHTLHPPWLPCPLWLPDLSRVISYFMVLYLFKLWNLQLLLPVFIELHEDFFQGSDLIGSWA
ncbi:uncharacterized protein LOC101838592 [Mesocricetus auratus]|uniref:Uncharacterized protein LOC101838592 n=1 Tax=Mesocricetus auratus TaxID=10036 RepID=A0A1U7QQB4_MESAU|nr:uncharacterized protein LOC101838592 [Mesocricetus auratus]